jgi:hypothetical protein
MHETPLGEASRLGRHVRKRRFRLRLELLWLACRRLYLRAFGSCDLTTAHPGVAGDGRERRMSVVICPRAFIFGSHVDWSSAKS